MGLELIRASLKDRLVFVNLMQLYMHDFSEFVDINVQENGLFKAYTQLEDYWKDDKAHFAYIIKKDGNYAGFVLVKYIEADGRSYYSVAEFFIMRKYRRAGLGANVAMQVFDLYKGNWEVFQKETNKPAQKFWLNVIDEYTKGKYTDRFESAKRIQNFQNA